MSTTSAMTRRTAQIEHGRYWRPITTSPRWRDSSTSWCRQSKYKTDRALPTPAAMAHIAASIYDEALVVGMRSRAALRVLHARLAVRDEPSCDTPQTTRARALHEFAEIEIVWHAVARKHQGVERRQRQRRANVDAHLGRAHDGGDDVALSVMRRLVLAQQTGLHCVAHRRMRHGLIFQLAALPAHQDQRIADVIGTDLRPLYLDGRERRRRPGAGREDGGVRALNAVEDGIAQANTLALRGAHRSRHALDREPRRQLTGRQAAQTIGDHQHRAMRVDRNVGRCVFVYRLLVRRTMSVGDCDTAGERILVGARKVGLCVTARCGERCERAYQHQLHCMISK